MFLKCLYLSRLILNENFRFLDNNCLSNKDWIKIKDTNGSLTNDSTLYSTAELTALNSSSTPSIGGTWVVNTPTASLPLTGGSGRIIAVVVSVGLAGIVAILVVAAKKKEKESKN